MSTDAAKQETPPSEPAEQLWPRQLTSHHGSAVNNQLKISVMDEAGPGGASSLYTIFVDDTPAAVEGEPPPTPSVRVLATLTFHQGNPADGVKGITIEALLAIAADRLDGWQSGKFACDENAAALGFTRSALDALGQRTASRIERGIEGTQEK